MPWAMILAQAASQNAGVSATEVVQFILDVVNLGVLGVVFWLFIRGHLHSDSEVGRLTGEIDRLVTEKAKAETQRDDALRTAQDKLVPLLTNFVSVTSVLIPLLQQAVAAQERPGGRRRTTEGGTH